MYKKTGFDKKAYVEKAKEQQQELNNKIEEMAETYTDSPEKLAELAAFRAKFHEYSMKNTMLIARQFPGASFVGSYPKFNEIGRSLAADHNDFDEKGRLMYYGVKKGAAGIKIFAPVKITYIRLSDTEWIQPSDATDAQKAAAKSGALETRTRTGYKLGTVFDISQTYIPPKYYPQIYSVGFSSEHHAKIFEGLKAYIENELDCPVEQTIESISLRGYCYTNELAETQINLSGNLLDTQRLSTLSHELGHFLMHRSADVDRPSPQREVEADIYSIMLESHFGLQTSDVRKAHLAASFGKYKELLAEVESVKPYDSIEKIFENANTAFNETIDGIEKYISLYLPQQEQPMQEELEEEISFEA